MLFSMLCPFDDYFFIFLFKQKTAYELRISDWSSDVCSSDLIAAPRPLRGRSVATRLAGHNLGRARTERLGESDGHMRAECGMVAIFPCPSSLEEMHAGPRHRPSGRDDE